VGLQFQPKRRWRQQRRHLPVAMNDFGDFRPSADRAS
jgi:hypothetical protein